MIVKNDGSAKLCPDCLHYRPPTPLTGRMNGQCAKYVQAHDGSYALVHLIREDEARCGKRGADFEPRKPPSTLPWWERVILSEGK